MIEIPDERRRREVAEALHYEAVADQLPEAIRAVLALQPPADEYEEMHLDAVARDAWWTCHATVVSVLHKALVSERGETS